MSYEKQGTAHDPHAAGYELQGRDKAPSPSEMYVEPELSCSHLDAFIAATSPPAEVMEEIETARNINSQLRYGLWHEKARAEVAEARIKALEEAIDSLPITDHELVRIHNRFTAVETASIQSATMQRLIAHLMDLRAARTALKENAP